MDGSPPPPSFSGIHAIWLGLSVLAGALFAFRPRPRLALLTLVLMHGAAFLGYYGGLSRTYAIGVSSDRALGVGMARSVANGGSAFDHIQLEFSNLEPLWTFFVAALSGFSDERVPFLYDRMALLMLALTALGFYSAWSPVDANESADEARWRGVFVAASVLGLSSFSLSDFLPTQHFWQANFVFKPNHALAFGLVGLLSRTSHSWVVSGVLQGLLIWVFILDWAYLLPGMLLTALLSADRGRALKGAVLGSALGLALGLRYIVHLLRDYNPIGQGEMPQIWRDQLGDRLISPYWWSLDLGPLLILSLLGIVFALKGSERAKSGAGFLLGGPVVALAYATGLRFGFAPEPDEALHFSRMVSAAAAGYALWVLARRWKTGTNLGFGIGYALILACSFPAYFDPPRHDRYFLRSLEPLPSPVLTAAEWINANTPKDSRFVCSGVRTGIMLSGLTGRRFLMVRPDQTADRAAREQAERDIFTSLDEATVRRAATRWGITHVLIDEELQKSYGDAARGLGNRPWFEPMFANSFLRILRLKPPG